MDATGAAHDGATHPPPVSASFDASGWPAIRLRASGIAAASLPLILERRRWIHRQVETLEFLDADRMRRHVSVDFTVPEIPAAGVLANSPATVVYLPIALLRREVMERFDLRDEQEAALPCLTVAQHDAITQSMLAAVSLMALAERGYEDPQEDEDVKAVLDVLHAMIVGRSRQARMEWEHLKRRRRAIRRDILAGDGARPLIEDLDAQFPLFVPLNASAGDRRVLKFAHDVDIEGRGHPRSVRERIGQPFGLRPLSVEAQIAGRAESIHIEVPAPDELFIADAQLLGWDDRNPQRRILARVKGPTPVAHLRPRRVLSRGTKVELVATFVPRRDGFATAAALVAFATTALLTSGLALHLAKILPRSDAAGAVVAAVPAVYAPALAISSAHRLVRRIVSRMRQLTLISAAISFAAAGTFAADLPTEARAWTWLGLWLGSLIPTLVLGFEWARAPLSAAVQDDG